MNQEEFQSFVIDLLKFSPLGLGYYLLLRLDVIPDKYSLPFALALGYILGMTVGMIEDFVERRRDGNHKNL